MERQLLDELSLSVVEQQVVLSSTLNAKSVMLRASNAMDMARLPRKWILLVRIDETPCLVVEV